MLVLVSMLTMGEGAQASFTSNVYEGVYLWACSVSLTLCHTVMQATC
jgi:hypothetical protein